MTETNATRAAGSSAPACSAYRCNHTETCANAACAAMTPHEHNDDCRWHICEYLNTTVACDYVEEAMRLHRIWTGLADDVGRQIHVGDVLYNKPDKYCVVVHQDTEGRPFGKLVCPSGHPCANVPYSLENGRNHLVVARPDKEP